MFKDLKVGDKIVQFGGSAEVLAITDFLVDGISCDTTKRFTLLEERDGVKSCHVRAVHLTTEADTIA